MFPDPLVKSWVSLNVDLQLHTLSQSNLLAGGLPWGQVHVTSLCRMEESMTVSRHVQRPGITLIYQLHKWIIIGKSSLSWETAGGNEILHRYVAKGVLLNYFFVMAPWIALPEES